MPKFHATVEFDLYTDVEPDLYGGAFDSAEDIEDFTDNSYFSGGSVEASGGSVEFTLDAEDEMDAERKAEGVVYDGMEVEDSNGLTWGVSNASVSVEAVEMDLDTALRTVRDWVRTADLPSEIREALDVVLRLPNFVR